MGVSSNVLDGGYEFQPLQVDIDSKRKPLLGYHRSGNVAYQRARLQPIRTMFLITVFFVCLVISFALSICIPGIHFRVPDPPWQGYCEDWSNRMEVIYLYTYFILLSGLGALSLRILPLNKFLNYSFIGGHRTFMQGFVISVGELIVIAATLVTAGIWWNHYFNGDYITGKAKSDPAGGATFLARWALSLGHMNDFWMALLILPVTRNSIWVHLFGIPFERTIKYHRWLGVILFSSLAIHVACWWIKWLMDGTFNAHAFNIGEPYSVTQDPDDRFWVDYFVDWMVPFLHIVCFPLFLLMAITSWSYIRRHYFDLFFYIHHIFILFYAIGTLHSWEQWHYTSFGIFLWIVDRVMRAYIGRFSGGVHLVDVKVNIDSKTSTWTLSRSNGKPFHWQPGQYAFLAFPTISELQWHPFTISNAPSSSGGKLLTHHIKNMGPGTFSESAIIYANWLADNGSLDFPVLWDGPYGNPESLGEGCAAAYHPVRLFCCGGIGVTPVASIVEEIYNTRPVDIQKVYVVWVVRYDFALDDFPIFAKIAADPSVRDLFELHVHVTRADSERVAHRRLGNGSSSTLQKGPAVPFRRGRPDIESIFNRIEVAHQGADVGVFGCGPERLIDSLSYECIGRQGGLTRFHLHTEVFLF